MVKLPPLFAVNIHHSLQTNFFGQLQGQPVFSCAERGYEQHQELSL